VAWHWGDQITHTERIHSRIPRYSKSCYHHGGVVVLAGSAYFDHGPGGATPEAKMKHCAHARHSKNILAGTRYEINLSNDVRRV